MPLGLHKYGKVREVLFVPGMANTNDNTFHDMEEARAMIDYEVPVQPYELARPPDTATIAGGREV
jgi:hypothetical protein